jgi:hypothetical protein
MDKLKEYVAKCEQKPAEHVIRIFTKDGSLMALVDLEVPDYLTEGIDGAGDVNLFPTPNNPVNLEKVARRRLLPEGKRIRCT